MTEIKPTNAIKKNQKIINTKTNKFFYIRSYNIEKDSFTIGVPVNKREQLTEMNAGVLNNGLLTGLFKFA